MIHDDECVHYLSRIVYEENSISFKNTNINWDIYTPLHSSVHTSIHGYLLVDHYIGKDFVKYDQNSHDS